MIGWVEGLEGGMGDWVGGRIGGWDGVWVGGRIRGGMGCGWVD